VYIYVHNFEWVCFSDFVFFVLLCCLWCVVCVFFVVSGCVCDRVCVCVM